MTTARGAFEATFRGFGKVETAMPWVYFRFAGSTCFNTVCVALASGIGARRLEF